MYINSFHIKDVIIIALLIALFFSIKGCYEEKITTNKEKQKLLYFENKVKEFVQKKNELEMNLAHQKQIVLEKTKDIENLLLENSELKKISSQIKLEPQTKIKYVFVPYRDTIYDTILNTCCNRLFEIDDKWYKISGITQIDGININEILFRDKITINTGYKKSKGVGGLFSKKVPTIEVINENPYTNLTGMNNITLKEKKAWYNTRTFYFTLGFSTAISIIILSN